MKDAEGKELKIAKCDRFDLIMDWRHHRLQCALCGSHHFVKYLKDGKTVCKNCVSGGVILSSCEGY